MTKLNAPRARTSRSCENCRVVKRRCDKEVPQCGQCIRTREICLGYRDEWDLIFRDQTNHTIKRSSKTRETNGFSTSAIPWIPPSRGLDPSLEEIGVNYFLRDFVAGGLSPSRGYLNYIPTVYSADAEHPALVASMAAVGLVALASHQPELVIRARAKYSEAICLVNQALACPAESVKDSTLMSVISLGVFEHISNFESWVRHVKGAAALVVARGKSQFVRRSAILMFNQVRADITTACIQTVQPFPDDLRELQEEATKYTDRSDASWLLGVLATRCATLYAGIAKKHEDKSVLIPTSWSDFLEESIAIQSGFQYVLDILTTQEPYITIREPRGSATVISCDGQYDLYRTSWAIRLWNNSRMVEIIVCEIVCWLINKVLTEEPAYPAEGHLKLQSKLQYTMQIMSRRGAEILASVPQGLGLVSVPDADRPQGPNVSGGYMLIWNLYTVGKSPAISHQTRQWVIKQLKGISERANIAMAFQLAKDLVQIGQTLGPRRCISAPSPPGIPVASSITGPDGDAPGIYGENDEFNQDCTLYGLTPLTSSSTSATRDLHEVSLEDIERWIEAHELQRSIANSSETQQSDSNWEARFNAVDDHRALSTAAFIA
ncbi:hypothetical protein CNMCM5623_000517 [Aspergillus felis]|uniref:Zn(2)-C6 fungal-type domain-containing protein n=1 Tax=Aspergillus felis TaxID=1287682 RepID=A0A8H6Q6L6_9EURO|nr:hypothetical protein CNMCM5623_000517 [Aspergillus felis]